jgi:hypothetical protein
MKKQISRVSVVQNAKFMGAMYFVITIPFVALFFLASLVMPGKSFLGGLAALIIGPIFYAIAGFVATAIAAFVYNFVAGFVGGIEYTTQDVAHDD